MVQVFEATATTAKRSISNFNALGGEGTTGNVGEGMTDANGMVTIEHGSGEQGSGYLVVANYSSVSCSAIVDINGRADIKFESRVNKKKTTTEVKCGKGKRLR